MNYAGQRVNYEDGGTESRWAGAKCDDANLNVNGWLFGDPHTHWGTGFKMTIIKEEMKTTSAHNHFASF